MFIARTAELRFLESRYAAPGGQLVVLYGRRRVGKTELLRKFCEGKDHVFYSCSEITNDRQLEAFSKHMLAKDLPAAQYIKSFSDWDQAFGSITELPNPGKNY